MTLLKIEWVALMSYCVPGNLGVFKQRLDDYLSEMFLRRVMHWHRAGTHGLLRVLPTECSNKVSLTKTYHSCLSSGTPTVVMIRIMFLAKESSSEKATEDIFP